MKKSDIEKDLALLRKELIAQRQRLEAFRPPKRVTYRVLFEQRTNKKWYYHIARGSDTTLYIPHWQGGFKTAEACIEAGRLQVENEWWKDHGPIVKVCEQ